MEPDPERGFDDRHESALDRDLRSVVEATAIIEILTGSLLAA
jgi:hypothetical protein